MKILKKSKSLRNAAISEAFEFIKIFYLLLNYKCLYINAYVDFCIL